MPEEMVLVTEAVFIDAARDPPLKALYSHWQALRHGRAMPTRQDFDPMQIPALLPFVILYGVGKAGDYTVRLVGEEIVEFAGRNATGGPAGHTMPRRSAKMLTSILDAVTRERAPKFRAGKAHWQPHKEHRNFEASRRAFCRFLPTARPSTSCSPGSASPPCPAKLQP